MKTCSFRLPFLLLLFAASFNTSGFGVTHANFNNAGCNEIERDALLKLKHELTDPSNLLGSWVPDDVDCCSWYGVICDNFTAHVTGLHLTVHSEEEFFASNATYDDNDYHRYAWESRLSGKISESLLNLKHLNYLNLSNNDFKGIKIPGFLGSIESLRYLDLSLSDFEGMVPHELGNLSNLIYLNLKRSDYGQNLQYVQNLQWLSSLESLEFIDLSSVDLSNALDWLDVLNTLPSLVELHLSECRFSQVNPPLAYVNFSSLTILDFSRNYFEGSHSVPHWIFGIKTLTCLDLFFNNFGGSIPVHLQNLTSLRELYLSLNDFNSSIPNWLGGFTHLELLDLSKNYLEGRIPSNLGNLTSLNTLELSANELEGGIPAAFKNLCKLNSLGLENIALNQEINEVIEILSTCASNRLDYLNLESSQLSGSIPNSLGTLNFLRFLYLGNNELSGTVPVSLGMLSKLEILDISHNSLKGEIFEIHFTNITNLVSIDGSGNQLILRVGDDWLPPFQGLINLALNSWQVGPMFPTWIRFLKHIKFLELSNSNIAGTLPIWFLNMTSTLFHLDLSHNKMQGTIPYLSVSSYPGKIPYSLHVQSFVPTIDLSSNCFEGSLPLFSSYPCSLDLSNNSFSGSITTFLCQKMFVSALSFLNLGENQLSGEIPDCWTNWFDTEFIILSDNHFSGNIPNSIGNLDSLVGLDLHKNNLSGEIPFSLQNCRSLVFLDLSQNELSGEIPSWIGKLQKMAVLNLRGNKFDGFITKQFCRMKSAQILDFSDNNLSGTIPKCVNNLTEMSSGSNGQQWGDISVGFYGAIISRYVSTEIRKNGKLVEYRSILNFVRSLDFSNNNLTGEIPQEITSLRGLQFLNLSHNILSGTLPHNIGDMKQLQFLDFCQNQFSGEIPQSISTLTFLEYLNVSKNKLSGEIPSGPQLQGFDPSCFSGNNLCGLPLTNSCSVDNGKHGVEEGTTKDDDRNGSEEVLDWFYFYVSIAPGFVIGFWGVVGPLIFNRRWRHFYFNFLNHSWNKIWVWFHIYIVRVVNPHS